MKIKNSIYIISYIIIAIFLIVMQHKVWHLSANTYFLVMVVYFIMAFITRILIKKKNKEKGD